MKSGIRRNSGYSIAAVAIGITLLSFSAALAQKKYDPGASDTEIKIGQTYPLSGPASAFAIGSRVELAYYRMLNERGGINGRKIHMLAMDDAYSPPKTVEQTRKLVEQDEVLALFGSLATATNVAVRKYLNLHKIPQLLVGSSSSQFNNPKQYPYSTSLYLGADQEAAAFAHYIVANKPDGKIGILYQNDDYGRDYLKAFRDVLGPKADSMIVKAVSYLATDPTIDQQVIDLKYSGADVFLNIATSKFGVLAIRKAGELQWKPLHIVGSSNTSIKNTIEPAGFDHSTGLISITPQKDPSDPETANDPDVLSYIEFMKKYLPEENPLNAAAVNGYVTASLASYILEKCGDDLTRDNVLKQAITLNAPPIGMLRQGVSIRTSPDNYLPYSAAVLIRFDGTKWVAIGAPIPLK